MTDDQQVTTLLRRATDDLPSDPAVLARAGLERGRTRYRRRQVGTAVAAATVLAVIGAGFALDGSGTSRAVDPPVADRSGSPAASGATEGPGGSAAPAVPRTLAIRAADLPDVWASLLPGEVTVPAPKPGGDPNPMDGFDPRQRFDDQPEPTFEGEPGPGVLADLVWNGVKVRIAVAPTDPSYGDTPMQRCVGGGEGANGACVATPDGGALQETTFADDDGGDPVRIVTRYTPDLWEVTAMTSGPGATPTLAQLETVADSDVWFD